MSSLGFIGWSMICIYVITCFMACVSLCKHVVTSEDKPKCIGSLLVIYVSLLLATRKCSLDVGLVLNVVVPTLLLLTLYIMDGGKDDRH